ncbi:DUF6265 family protein [Sphingomonas sp. MMS24-J45]|uniref:DUF6265 family protein n=1 Tax=Sphingomonas sp. MMS24-J45 TaxID=3238806 RepID=UPI00384F1BF1
MLRTVTAILIALATPAAAQHTRILGDSAPASASIAQLEWLTGSWVGTGMGAEIAETYSAALGGRISGHFVMADGKGGVAFTELVDYVPVGQSLAYRVRHFNADMTGWEDKTGNAVQFMLVAVEKDHWFFDGMTLERTGPDALTMWVRITKEGKAEDVPFRFVRARSHKR